MNILKSLLYIFLLLVFFFSFGCRSDYLELSDNDSCNIEGEWEIYPSIFLYSDKVDQSELRKLFFRFPFNPASSANNYDFYNDADHAKSKKSGDGFGYGTIRKLVEVDLTSDTVYLRIPEIPSSYNLWINGVFRDSVGIPGKSKADTKPGYRIDFYELKNGRDFTGNQVEIGIEYANFTNRMATVSHNLTIHSKRGFERTFFINNFVILLVNGVLLFLFIYYGLLFFMNRVYLQNLYFSLFALSLLLRQIILGQEITSVIFYGISWHLKYTVWYILIIVQLWLYNQFIATLFKYEASKLISRLLSVICVVYSIFCVFSQPEVFTATIIFPQMTALMFGLYVHVVIVRAIINKRKGAILVIVGNFVMFLAVINDVLYSHGILQTGRLLTIGALVFIIAQANLLAVVYTDNVRKIAMVTDRLSLINTIYGYFVPAGLTSLFNKEKTGDVKAGDFVTKKMCVFILDIRDFTSLSETMSAKECFDFINGFLSEFVPVIKQCRGLITGFAGDQINGLFEKSSDGVEASIKIGRLLARYNKDRLSQGLVQINIGIGLCTGEVVLGISGNQNRIQLTAVSGEVQKAILLESLTKYTGSMIIADKSVLDDSEDSIKLSSRRIGRYSVSQGVQSDAYEMIFSFMPKSTLRRLETKYLFERALNDLESGRIESAGVEFSSLLQENPNDELIKWYLRVKNSIVKSENISVSLDGLYEA